MRQRQREQTKQWQATCLLPFIKADDVFFLLLRRLSQGTSLAAQVTRSFDAAGDGKLVGDGLMEQAMSSRLAFNRRSDDTTVDVQTIIR